MFLSNNMIYFVPDAVYPLEVTISVPSNNDVSKFGILSP